MQNCKGRVCCASRDDDGYAMAALLVSLAMMSIMMSVALPVWRQAIKREKEAELIFRGEQYARAIVLFQRKMPGAMPPNLEILVDQRFLRKKYRDPMVKDGEFQIMYQTSVTSPQAGAQTGRPQAGPAPAQPATSIGGPTSVGASLGGPGARGGIIGVVSKSKERSLRLYNGRDRYNEWTFLFSAVTQRPGAVPGAAQPGMQPGRPGQPRPGMPQGPRPGGPGMPSTPGSPMRPPGSMPITIPRPPG